MRKSAKISIINKKFVINFNYSSIMLKYINKTFVFIMSCGLSRLSFVNANPLAVTCADPSPYFVEVPMLHVMSYLPLEDLKNAACVCRAWHVISREEYATRIASDSLRVEQRLAWLMKREDPLAKEELDTPAKMKRRARTLSERIVTNGYRDEFQAHALDLRDLQLLSVPKAIDEISLTWLLLGENQLTAIPRRTNVRAMVLRYNEIAKIHVETFNQFTQLECLELEHNRITEIPSGIYLPRLLAFTLENNAIGTVSDDIRHLPNLEMLDLCRNQVRIIPDAICALRKLKRLYLDNNSLSEIARGICNLPELKVLSLEGNKITRIPKEICNLENLEALYLSQNAIVEWPNELCYLPKLQVLRIAYNHIRAIPSSVHNLTALEILDLKDNQLHLFPPSLCDIPPLCELDLRNNHIEEIPEEIEKMENLRYLHLTGNPLNSLPASLQHLELARLDVDDIPEHPETAWSSAIELAAAAGLTALIMSKVGPYIEDMVDKMVSLSSPD